MAMYLLIAAVTTCMAAIVDKMDNRAGKVTLMVAISVIFCFFAGARSITVGTDTASYGYPTFLATREYSLATFLSNQTYLSWGILYKLVTWIASNTFGTFESMLFAIELCTVVPVVVIGYKYTDHHLVLVIALFSLYFYPLSFNLMRQLIAMGFLLVAWYALDHKKMIGYFIWLVVAILFHSSAVLGLMLLVIELVARPSKIPYKRKALFFIAASIVCVLLLPYVLNAIAPFLPHYGAYMIDSKYAIRGHGYRNLAELVFVLIILCSLCHCFVGREFINRPQVVRERVEKLLLVVVFGVIVTGITPFSVYLGRVGLYFLYFAILLMPNILDLFLDKKQRLIFATVSIAVVAFLSLDLFVITGQHEVIPYVFSTS